LKILKTRTFVAGFDVRGETVKTEKVNLLFPVKKSRSGTGEENYG